MGIEDCTIFSICLSGIAVMYNVLLMLVAMLLYYSVVQQPLRVN